MKRKILIIAIALSLFFGGMAVADSVNGLFENNPIVKIFNAGKELIPADIPAIIYHNRTMVPLSLLKQAGYTLTWDPQTYSVSIDNRQKLSRDDILKMKDGIGIIYCYDASGNMKGRGTGFVINQTELITAHHVTEGFAKLTFGSEQFSQGNIGDAFIDYFGVKIGQSTSLKYSTALPQIGDHVYALGFPHGIFAMTEGVVTAFPTSRGITFIQNTAHVDNGSSGGILVNDYGEVIGITVSAVNNTDINDATPMQYVQQALDKL